MLRKLIVLGMALVMLFMVIGCGEGGNTSTTPSQIVITPGTASVIYGGGQKQFNAVCRDTGGNVMNVTLSWSVNSTSVGTINQNGLFTAGNKGNCIVTCSYGSVSAQSTVNVVGMKDAGEQLVTDVQSSGTVIGALLGLNSTIKFSKIKLVTDLPYVSSCFVTINDYINIEFFSYLFKFTPGTYPLTNVYSNTPQNSTYQQGTWTVNNGDWMASITRAVSGANDNITFTITNVTDSTLSYGDSLSYPTSLLSSPNVDLDASINLSFKNQHIAGTATATGTLHLSKSAETATFNGNTNFKFKDGEQFVMTGELSFAHDTATKDYLKGTITTSNLTITGEIDAQYDNNVNVSASYFNLFPKSIILNGSIRTNATITPIVLSGTLDISILNAATFNPNLDYSGSNWINGSATFAGSVQNGLNKVEGSLKFESTAYAKYALTHQYSLTSGGVKRELSAKVSNPNAGNYQNLHLVVTSDWGSAVITADFSLNADYSNLTAVSGTVTSNGVTVGTISLTGGQLRVNFTNGDFETF